MSLRIDSLDELERIDFNTLTREEIEFKKKELYEIRVLLVFSDITPENKHDPWKKVNQITRKINEAQRKANQVFQQTLAALQTMQFAPFYGSHLSLLNPFLYDNSFQCAEFLPYNSPLAPYIMPSPSYCPPLNTMPLESMPADNSYPTTFPSSYPLPDSGLNCSESLPPSPQTQQIENPISSPKLNALIQRTKKLKQYSINGNQYYDFLESFLFSLCFLPSDKYVSYLKKIRRLIKQIESLEKKGKFSEIFKNDGPIIKLNQIIITINPNIKFPQNWGMYRNNL